MLLRDADGSESVNIRRGTRHSAWTRICGAVFIVQWNARYLISDPEWQRGNSGEFLCGSKNHLPSYLI
jgi:hypothetical protein